jgi:riboflavin transporter FmnP
VEGVLVCLLKESLRCIGSSSNGAGELANFFVTSVYLLLPAILYQYRKTLKTVILSLSLGCVLATCAALLLNRFLVFPAFALLGDGTIMGMSVAEAFNALWLGLLVFNVIKTVLVGILTILLYKRLSNLMKKMKI